MDSLHATRRTSRSLIGPIGLAMSGVAMLGLGAIAQAGPRPGAAHEAQLARHAAPAFNTTLPVTTLPVPEITGSRLTMRESRLAQPVAHGMAAVATDSVATDDAATDGAQRGNAHGVFPIQWRESRELVGPEFVSRIRNYKRDGLPVVQLWEAGQSRVAIGLNTHGVPGIYFTHHVGG